VTCLRACSLDDWFTWIQKSIFTKTKFDHVWELLLREPEFGRKLADYDDDSFKSSLEAILKRTQEKSELYDFCDTILLNWNAKIGNSPNNTMQIDEKGIFILSYPILTKA
jgi:hypothetical protein